MLGIISLFCSSLEFSYTSGTCCSLYYYHEGSDHCICWQHIREGLRHFGATDSACELVKIFTLCVQNVMVLSVYLLLSSDVDRSMVGRE